MHIKLIEGDCLDKMKEISDNSMDMILADPPYKKTDCDWDSIIQLDLMWEQLKRVIKKRGAIVMTASQPFTSILICSNIKMFKYCWVWEKSNPSNPMLANKQPMRYHEDICVFYFNSPTYNKQMIKRTDNTMQKLHNNNYIIRNLGSEQTGFRGIAEIEAKSQYNTGLKNPSSVIKINSLRPISREFCKHPTQKPVALMEYLIKTYTNENEMVLDFAMGAGTTGVACINLSRKFIGIEKKKKYFNMAEMRIKKELSTARQVPLF